MHCAAVALQHDVRGAGGEPALESWGVHASGRDLGPGVILSALFRPGIALPVATLRRALGAACFGDGMLTIRDPSEMSSEYRLPLSEASRFVVAHGERPLALFATVKPLAASAPPPLPGQTQPPSTPPPIPTST